MRPPSGLAVALIATALAAGATGGASGFTRTPASTAHAQTLLPKESVQHVEVKASASATTVAPGSRLTLWADVSPKPSVHVYAAGAKDFTPVTLVLTPNGSIRVGTTQFPAPRMTASPGTSALVPAYDETFRISLPITVSAAAKSGETLTLGGAVRYQACDDRLCYPVTAAPVTWQLHIE